MLGRALARTLALASFVAAAACSDAEPTRPEGPTEPVVPPVCPEGAPPAAAPLAAPVFVPAEDDAGLSAIDTALVYRAQVADIDGDHLDDLVLSGYPDVLPPPTRVLLGTSEGRFADATAASGLEGVLIATAAWGDVDRDGDVDLVNFVTPSAASDLPETSRGVWLNDGSGHFTHAGTRGLDLDTSGTTVDNPHSITLADLDRDGALDVYLVTWFASDGNGGLYAPTRDRLFRGLGDGSFVDITEVLGDQVHPESPAGSGLGRPGFGVAPGDYDDDADVDLFVSAYGAGRPKASDPPRHWEYNLLWQNDGAMSFRNVGDERGVAASYRGIGGVEDERIDPGPVVMGETSYYQPIGGNSFGAVWADVDSDGDLDLLVTNIAHPDYPQSDRTLLYTSSGPPDYSLTEVSAERGLVWREYELFPAVADVDGDGLPDIAIAGQWVDAYGGAHWELYRQRPDHGFDLLAYEQSGVDDEGQPGWNFIDFDHDGDLDLYLAKFEGQSRLFRNVAGDANRHLVVRFEGDATGARVTLETSAGKQLREVTSGSSHYNQQLSHAAWFGLGGDACARAVTVRWPDGSVIELGDVAADRTLIVSRDGTIRDAW